MQQLNSLSFCSAIFIGCLLHIDTLWGCKPGRKKTCLSCNDITGAKTIGYD